MWRFQDESYKAGVRIKGFHKDVTEQMELEIREDDKHKVVEFEKIENVFSLFHRDV